MNKCIAGEEWRDINGYEGIYQVSNLGRIKSLSRKRLNGRGYYIQKERIIKQAMTSTGYKMVVFSVNKVRKYFKVHRLVAFAFLGLPPKNRTIINHKDGNPLNNNVNNLEWCSQKYNNLHAHLTGLIKDFRISRKELKKRIIVEKKTYKEIAKEYNVTATMIYNKAKKYGFSNGRGRVEKYYLPPEMLKWVIERRVTQTTLAKAVGCDQSAISHRITKYKRSGLL